MHPEDTPTGNLNDELRSLGENLERLLRIAWGSEERKRAQKEIEAGLGELAETLRGLARGFAESSTGQEIQSEMREIGAKLKEANLGERAREELLEALRRANAELTRAASRWSGPGSGPGAGS
jgi:hypothetical protein